MLPEGASVTAVVTVVVLFLKHMNGRDAVHQEVVKTLTTSYNDNQKEERKTFSDELRETRTTFSEQLKEVTAVFSERHEATQEKITTLTESHIKVSSETVGALNGLKDAVRDLQEKVK
jgi:type I site-specific restriction endonuclease